MANEGNVPAVDSDRKEQSHFRSLGPQKEVPGRSSSWRQQTDYISSVCRMHEPLSSSLRQQPLITRAGEGGGGNQYWGGEADGMLEYRGLILRDPCCCLGQFRSVETLAAKSRPMD